MKRELFIVNSNLFSRGWLTIILVLFWGCESSDVKKPTFQGNSKISANATAATATNTANITATDSNNSGDGVSGDLPKPADVDDADAVVSYPTLTFKATGWLSCESYSAGLAQEVVADMDTEQFKYNVVSFTSDNSRANQNLAAHQGVTTYQRVPKEELLALEKEGFNNAPYALFTKEATSNTGTKYTFSKPVPVFPIPAKLSRYEELDKGDVPTWTATATATYPNGAGSVDYNVTIKIQKATQPAAAGDYSMTISVQGGVPQDFPIPTFATYGLDTTARLLMAISSVGYFNYDGHDGTASLSHKLCKSAEQDKPDKTFTCP